MIKKVSKVWGSEEWLVNNELYCSKFLNLKKGYRSSLHYHRKKDETFYVLEGRMKLEYSTKSSKKAVILGEGDYKRIKPGHLHRFRATTNTAKILEVSTHHEDNDSIRIEPGGEIPKIKEGLR